MNLDQLYVLNPELIISEENKSQVSLFLPSRKKRFDVRTSIVKVLDSVRKPVSLQQIKDVHSLSMDVIYFLIREMVVVPAEDAKIYEHGLLTPSSHPIGYEWEPTNLQLMQDRWCLFGVPISYPTKKDRIFSANGGTQAIRNALSLFHVN